MERAERVVRVCGKDQSMQDSSHEVGEMGLVGSVLNVHACRTAPQVGSLGTRGKAELAILGGHFVCTKYQQLPSTKGHNLKIV